MFCDYDVENECGLLNRPVDGTNNMLYSDRYFNIDWQLEML